jgi:hypothetical protein
VADDIWSSPGLVARFADDACASVKGYVRTYVMHQHHCLPRWTAELDIETSFVIQSK